VPAPSDRTYAFGWNQAAWERWFDFKSFTLGVVATALGLLLISGGTFLFRRLRRRSHERELRRIASMDS
jgi:hypothetical protein